MTPSSLTEMQLAGGGAAVNVAEGYPLQRLTPAQDEIVTRFPELMHDALTTGFPELEARAQAAFFSALGQVSAPVGSGRIISFYSSSQAIDVLARCISESTSEVAVAAPTLDCIPALLHARHLHVVPVTEEALLAGDPFAELSTRPGALFIANPNNPTGTHLDRSTLLRIADECVARDVVLVIDQCFRAFETRTQYDTYDCLESTGVDYALIEDTGKLWPVSGLKLGFLCTSIGTRLPVGPAAADVLLTPSSFATRVVEELAIDMAAGGLEHMHSLVARNRSAIADALEGFPAARVVDEDSYVSVSRVGLADSNATVTWGRLLKRGVHTVPCRPFYWSDPAEGERYVRVALSRNPEDVVTAATAIREVVTEMVPV